MHFLTLFLILVLSLFVSSYGASAGERPSFADENCECSALLRIVEFENPADEVALRSRLDLAAERFELSCLTRMGQIYESHIESYATYWTSLPDGIETRTAFASTLSYCGAGVGEEFRGLDIRIVP